MVLGTTGFSTGELTLTFDFVSRLERPLELHAVISRRTPHLIKDDQAHVHFLPALAGAGLVAAITDVFERVRPDVLLVADLFVVALGSPELGALFHGRSLLAPFLAHAAEHCRVIFVDLYDWDQNAAQIDVLGRSCAPLCTPVPSTFGRLLPSPYLRPAHSTPGRGRYAMMGRCQLCAQPKEVRAALGLGSRAVMVPSSLWQHGFKQIEGANRTSEALPELTYSLLDAAAGGEPVDVVQLGPQPLPLPAHAKSLRLVHVPQLPAPQYLDLLGAIDLVVSTNAIATTGIRAASLGVPVASLFVGSRQAPASLPKGPAGAALSQYLKACAPIYPLAVGAFGMANLLEVLLADNPFASIQERLDVLDPERAVDGLRRLLFDPTHRDELSQAQDCYFGRLSKLVDAPERAFQAALEASSS